MYADNFHQIAEKLGVNLPLKISLLSHIESRPILGKALDGEGRIEKFRNLLSQLVKHEITIEESYESIQLLLPESASPHAGNKRVFPAGWGERLIWIQLSRFYNQCVLVELRDNGIKECFVPHSSHEDAESECSLFIAGRNNDVETLLARLISCYEEGVYDKQHRIPHHPHCTHVIKPV